jgi:hypothetical protein
METILMIVGGLGLLGVFMWASQEDKTQTPRSIRQFMGDDEVDEDTLPYAYLWKRK